MILLRFFILSVFLSGPLIAQLPSDLLPEPNNINIAYLEHLTKSKIDSVRAYYGLQRLYNDSILYVAAAHHGSYLQGKKLSHYEPEFDLFKTPQLRAEFFGAKNYACGENLARVPIYNYTSIALLPDKKNSIRIHVNTYHNAAHALMLSWVNSPPHFENIKTEAYDVTGMNISLDTSGRFLTAVQKFAKVIHRYHFSNTGTLFPYAPDFPASLHERRLTKRNSYPWKLKERKTSDSIRIAQLIRESAAPEKLNRENNSIRFLSYRIPTLKKMIKRRRDGMAVELVSSEPFECENPDYDYLPFRRNNHSFINGEVLKPVYKRAFFKSYKEDCKKLLKEKKTLQLEIRKNASLSKEEKEKKLQEIENQSWEPEFMEVLLGSIPEKLPALHGDIESNILILQKKRVAYVLHFSGACDKGKLLTSILPSYPQWTEVPIPDVAENRKTLVAVPFERNSFSVSEEQISHIREAIPKHPITEIQLQAWASVEGLESINLELQQKRVDAMKSIITPFLSDSSITLSIQSGENWKMFYEQLEQSPYRHWKKYKKEEIKRLLEKEENILAFDKFLDDQRIARLAIFTRELKPVNSSLNMALQVYKSFLLQIKNEPSKSLDPQLVQYACTMQKHLIDRWKNGEISLDALLHIDIPLDKKFAPLLLTRCWLRATYLAPREPWNLGPDHLRELKLCASVKPASVWARYNLAVFYVNAWRELPYPGTPNARDLLKLLRDLPEASDATPYSKDGLDSLFLFFHIKNAYAISKVHFFHSDLNYSLSQISSYYRSKVLSDSMCYELAGFFLQMGRPDLSLGILAPALSKEKPDRLLLMLYLKLSYIHVENASDQSFYEELLNAYHKLSQEDWCSLFQHPCGISFQVFDHRATRDFYCEKCIRSPQTK
ncbi:MAG: CAP domain-containing protein [Cytophagaceae bacterium]|nr:CAP domain-containing protein [Cytophagaceae bacterium]